MAEIEMGTYEGRCKYCGNIQPIMAMDQIDANEQISEKCPELRYEASGTRAGGDHHSNGAGSF